MINKSELPKNWEISKFGEVCHIIMGQSPPSDTYNFDGIGLPFFQGKAEFTDLYPIVKKWCSEPNKIAEQNDILLSVRAPVGSTNIANQKCCIGRGLAAIRFNNFKYAFYFLRSIEKKLDEKGTGTTFKAISGETVREIDFPLPPLAEQERIVAKIEELFSELYAGRESLKTAARQLKTYRQAVLKWAFEGKLTNETVNEGELPAGWKIKTFAELAKVKSNLVSPENFKSYPHIAPDNIERETGKLLEYRTIEEDKVFSPKHLFFKGQIVYSKIRPYLNKLIIAPFDGLCSADMYPIESELEPRYLFHFMLSQLFVQQASTAGSRSVLPKINQNELSKIRFNVPPTLEEQQRIVEEIESRLSVCDKLEETIAASLKQSEALRQSILKKAFEGKLVQLVQQTSVC